MSKPTILPKTMEAMQADVDALKTKNLDTKILYGQVADLLFLKYGFRPTASGLYAFVQKGSMTVPNDVVQDWYKKIRDRLNLTIDEPLPEEIKRSTIKAMTTLWAQAMLAARAELNQVRAETVHNAELALGQVESERQRAAEARSMCNAMESEKARLEDQLTSLQEQFHREQRDHAEARGRTEALDGETQTLRQQLVGVRSDFSAEVGRMRADHQAAQQRFDANERRALLDVDQARVARAAVEKQLAEARIAATAVESERRTEAIERAGTIATLRAKLTAAVTFASENATALLTFQSSLAAKSEDASAQRARADTLQAQVALLTSAASSRPESSAAPVRRPRSSKSAR